MRDLSVRSEMSSQAHGFDTNNRSEAYSYVVSLVESNHYINHKSVVMWVISPGEPRES